MKTGLVLEGGGLRGIFSAGNLSPPLSGNTEIYRFFIQNIGSPRIRAIRA